MSDDDPCVCQTVSMPTFVLKSLLVLRVLIPYSYTVVMTLGSFSLPFCLAQCLDATAGQEVQYQNWTTYV